MFKHRCPVLPISPLDPVAVDVEGGVVQDLPDNSLTVGVLLQGLHTHDIGCVLQPPDPHYELDGFEDGSPGSASIELDGNWQKVCFCLARFLCKRHK